MIFDEWWNAEGKYSTDLKSATEDAWRTAVIEERQQCWDAINAAIKSGDLPGDGTDKTAERNGLVLATNIVMVRMRSKRALTPDSQVVDQVPGSA